MLSGKLRFLAKGWTLRVPGHIRNGHEKAQVWTKESTRILEASTKPTWDGFSGLIAHGHPLYQKYPCSFTRLPYNNGAIRTCRRLMEYENPHFLRFKDVLEDGDLFAVQEPSVISFEAYFKTHVDDFLVGLQSGDFLTVSPLCQRLFRELLTAAHQLKEMNLPFVPNVANTPLHIGTGGTVSIKVNPFLCVPPELVVSEPPPTPLVSVPPTPLVSLPPAPLVSVPNQLRFGDPLVGHCAEEMGRLLGPHLCSIELDDLISKAVNGQWWGDLGDLFLHPFFWTPQMHESFISNMDILMYRRYGDSSMDGLTLQRLHSLRLLANALRKEWQLQPALWGGPWVAHCPFQVPADWANIVDHKDTVVRQVRNVIQHPHGFNHLAITHQWDHRRDLFIYFMNKTHAISPNLFHAYWSVKRSFESSKKYQGLDTSMWKSALSSVLPKGM